MAANKMNWPFEDQMASIDATVAILTPNEDAIRRAASLQGNSIAKQESEALRVALQKAADNNGKPCAWVEKLIDRSIPLNAISMQPSWGFVVLRDAKTEFSNEDWEVFLQKLETTFFEGVSWLVGGEQINQTRKLFWQDQFVDENDHEGLHRAFQDVVRLSPGLQKQIIQNTFLLITPEVVASFESSSITPWIWAFDTTFDPSAPIQADSVTKFDGRLKVASTSVFTWFYAARKEEIYGMNQFWECAQKQPDQVWKVATELGLYHDPLVSLTK
ncbi:uncharacterized protein EAE97_005127 [Botrytis byssoidea]|uniref:Uncharacterized protein n=1 Tax=Botrytis byssoidea TaxID=139641 RepID=A0A9P5ILV9_9HELO|nr:uncharacterized protein EAE97_005127 [Botrytis byssoidea]KAF7946089.1 hypothetical protein EAE97_005127 [Botrytis byssoidea]